MRKRWAIIQISIAWYLWKIVWWLLDRNATQRGRFEMMRRSYNKGIGFGDDYEEKMEDIFGHK